MLCSAKCSINGEMGRTMAKTEKRHTKVKKDSYKADLNGCDTNVLSLTTVLTVLCLKNKEIK